MNTSTNNIPPVSALHLLQDTFGFRSFRNLQEEIITHVIAGKDALVLMPTGGGKSLCYQIPSMVRPGTGIVVSPLIALMQDQVTGLQQMGIKAAYLNSSLKAQEAVDGKVVVSIYKGNVTPVSRYSPTSLYDQALSSMDVEGGFNAIDSKGFINIHALRLKAHNLVLKGKDPFAWRKEIGNVYKTLGKGI